MKTSNALLISLIAISILLIGAVPITFKYRIKAGEYALSKPEELFAYNRHHFQNIRNVKINYISQCTIIPFDSVVAEVDRTNLKNVSLRISGDTLIVSGDSAQNSKVRILLPGNSNINLLGTTALLKGQLSPLKARSFKVQIERSDLSTSLIFDDKDAMQFFDTLTLIGKGEARVNLMGNAQIRKLNLYDIDKMVCIKLGFEASDFEFYNTKMVSSVGREDTLIISGRK